MLNGEIVFLKETYGFIKSNEGTQYFFLTNNVEFENSDINTINFLDTVTFEIYEVENGKHKGKLNARNIRIISKSESRLTDYFHPVTIGTITKKLKSLLVLSSPELEKDTLLYRTRILFDKRLEIGDLCVFHPVKLLKPEPYFFAFFVYNIQNETDFNFLLQKYSKNKNVELEEYIKKLNISLDNLSEENKFNYEISKITPIDNTSKYISLKALINKYKGVTSYKQMNRFLNEKYLLLLWQENVIQDYDLNSMKQYFHTAKANEKRWIIEKVKVEDRASILKHHIDQLENENRFSRLNNSIKTLLDITLRNPETANKEAYQYLLLHIEHLEDSEKYDLWLNGYLKEINSNILNSSINLNDLSELIKTLDKIGNTHKLYLKIQNYFEDKILNFSKKEDLNLNEYLLFPKYIFLFKKLFESRYSQLLPNFTRVFTKKQIFILCVFNLYENEYPLFDINTFINSNPDEVNAYYFIRLVLNKKVKFDFLQSKYGVNFDNLVSFINAFNWNLIIYPTNKEYLNNVTIAHFLDDIKRFNEISQHDVKIDIKELAKQIYNRIPKFSVEHLRLWMDYLSDERDYFEYSLFNPYYKLLEKEEQKIFKKLADRHNKDDRDIIIRSKISPCINVIHNGNEIICIASISNIFFSSDNIELYVVLNDKKKIIKGKLAGSDIGFNSLPIHFGEFANIPFKITLNERFEIISMDGFDYLFTLIQERYIERALGNIGIPIQLGEKTNVPSYAEDWQLKEQIISYLNSNSCRAEFVAEPKNLFKRIDEDSDIDSYEKTGLYVFDNEDEGNEDFSIVWENIDYSSDRATYIFKSSKENLESQLEKLKDAIGTSAQLRSTLKKTITDENSKLEIFKDYYGYIANIQKQRGRNYPFVKWESKLKAAFNKPIPIVPTSEEWDQIKKEIFVEHSSHPISKSTRTTNPKNVAIYVPEPEKKIDEEVPVDTSGFFESSSNIELQKTLDQLKELNTIITNLLN